MIEMGYSWKKDPYKSIVPPRKDGVYLSIAYGLKDVATAAKIFAGEEKGYAYARCGEGNPTVRAFERAMAEAEKAMPTTADHGPFKGLQPGFVAFFNPLPNAYCVAGPKVHVLPSFYVYRRKFDFLNH